MLEILLGGISNWSRQDGAPMKIRQSGSHIRASKPAVLSWTFFLYILMKWRFSHTCIIQVISYDLYNLQVCTLFSFSSLLWTITAWRFSQTENKGPSNIVILLYASTKLNFGFCELWFSMNFGVFIRLGLKYSQRKYRLMWFQLLNHPLENIGAKYKVYPWQKITCHC